MSRARKIVVEAIITTAVEVVWDRTQTPSEHVRWDIRFDSIDYLDRFDARGFRLMDYRTSVASASCARIGRYLRTFGQALTFGSRRPIGVDHHRGRGIWLYEPCAEGLFQDGVDLS